MGVGFGEVGGERFFERLEITRKRGVGCHGCGWREEGGTKGCGCEDSLDGMGKPGQDPREIYIGEDHVE